MLSLKLGEITNNLQLEYEAFTFPGGECHIKILEDIYNESVLIESSCINSDELIMILLANDALRRRGVTDISLLLPYIPYARQDRVCVSGESLSIKVLSDIINTCSFRNVYVLDPHSIVSTALINNIIEIPMSKVVDKLPISLHDILVSPDVGARKKTEHYAVLRELSKIAYCDKHRNLNTGEITHLSIDIDFEVEKDSSFWVLDDICDGGRTFLEIGKKLFNSYGRSHKYNLFITHGIFKEGAETINKLKKYYNEIYTTNSITTKKSIKDKVNIIKIQGGWL
jgi:ribose-phosphate pyrophosphokinase